MADETTNPPSGNAPPKIKLNLTNPSVPPREAAPPISIRASEKKAETTRIELSQALPPPAAASVGDTQPVHADPSVAKRSTIRIDAPAAAKAETQKVKTQTQKLGPAALHNTMRVEIAEPRKVETTRIDIPAEAFQKAPGTAPRAPTPPGADDIFKRSTIPMGIPTPPPVAVAKPKTIAVKRPVSPPPTPEKAEPPPSPADRAVAEAKKSETARIDLPSDAGGERPPTRPKTIRIKRPDGTTARKALTIARPETAAESGSVPMGTIGEEEPVGTAFSALALVALLVLGVVLYVLAAQTVLPNLPWPGRV